MVDNLDSNMADNSNERHGFRIINLRFFFSFFFFSPVINVSTLEELPRSKSLIMAQQSKGYNGIANAVAFPASVLSGQSSNGKYKTTSLYQNFGAASEKQ